QPQPIIRVFVLWIQRDHALHFHRRILEIMLRNVGLCQSRVGRGEVGLQAYGFLKLRNSFVRLSLPEKCDSVLSMQHIRVGALQPHHATEHEQSSGKQHCNPSQMVVMSRSNLMSRPPMCAALSVRAITAPKTRLYPTNTTTLRNMPLIGARGSENSPR